MLTLSLSSEYDRFVCLHTRSFQLHLGVPLAIVLLQVTWVGVGLAAALTHILAILLYVLHVFALVIFVLELHVSP